MFKDNTSITTLSFKNTKLNNSKNLIKTQSKTFLSKYYKGYFQTLEMEKIEKEVEYLKINEPIIFENNKFTILDSDPNKIDTLTRNLLTIMYAIIGLTSYKLAFAIYNFKSFGTFFWTTILYYSIRIRLGIIANQEHIIKEINVFKDGKTCEIITLRKTFTADINKIRKINMEEALFMSNKLESIKKSYIPIVIETSVYLVPIRSRIHRKDFLTSVCDGIYLDFKEVVHKDNSIHV